MGLSFHDLPAELVENVFQHLTLHDKCSLRLASTRIKGQIDNSSFREYFRKKRVHLTKEILEDFVRLSRTSEFVCLLQELVLVGVVWFKATPPTTNGDHMLRGKLLSEALDNVRTNSQLQNLHLLSLEVVTIVGSKILTTDEALFGSLTRPCKSRPSLPVWKTMTETFQTTAFALAYSKIPVQQLDLFSNVLRCGLACDAFDLVADLDLSPTLEHVQQLSMRVSNPFPPPWRPRSNSQYSRQTIEAVNTWASWKGKLPMYKQAISISAIAASNESVAKNREKHSSIGTWLKGFPNLESLDVRWFDIALHGSLHQEDSQEKFRQALESFCWPKLSTLFLANISISVKTLHQCIRNNKQLRRFTLRDVHTIDSDSYDDFVRCFKSMDRHVHQVHVINLATDISSTPMSLHFDNEPGKGIGPRMIREHGHDVTTEWSRQLYGPPWRLD